MASGLLQALTYGPAAMRTATVSGGSNAVPNKTDGTKPNYVVITATDYMFTHIGELGYPITSSNGILLAPGKAYIFSTQGASRIYRLRFGGSDVDYNVAVLEND